MSAENPKITPLHATFHHEIGKIAGLMTDFTVAETGKYLGEPPAGECRAMIFDSFASISYGADYLEPESQRVTASIAGSDAVSVQAIMLPEHVSGNLGESCGNRFFPGRILDLVLYYGINAEQGHEYRLYAGPGAPPMMVDLVAAQALLDAQRQDGLMLQDLQKFRDRLPENKFHKLSGEDLETVLRVLSGIRGDINPVFAYEGARDDYDDGQHPEKTNWLRPRVAHLRRVSTLGALAAQPFPGR